MGFVHQEALNFDPPVQQGGSLLSRHCSSMGAVAASEVAGRQMLTVLLAYKTHGPLTDIDVASLTGVQKSSVIPRRRALMKAGLVVEVQIRVNPVTGRPNMTYAVAGAQ